MTRLNLLSTLVAAPAALLVGSRQLELERDVDTLHLGPGTYTIGRGGGIWVTGIRNCRIENCRFDPMPVRHRQAK